MVPLPIGLLTLMYAGIVAAASASIWGRLIGRSEASLVWSAGWLAVSLGAVCGLALLRRWGRRLAMWGFAGLMATTLAMAAHQIAGGPPVAALATAITAGLQYLGIRYLRRTHGRAWCGHARPSAPRDLEC